MSTLLDFYIGNAIWKNHSIKRKKILLCISLCGNLGLLGFFKYVNFAIMQFNIFGNKFDLVSDIEFLDIALPIGISFYTFQTISYTIDIYRGKLKPCTSLREFALFVSFFPQLVAGPIIRAKDFIPQMRESVVSFSENSLVRRIIIENSNLKTGITMMAIGFLKKMVFADNLAPFVTEMLGNPIGQDSTSIIFGTIAFGMQIYGDFSGYSDIAIGAALILGFKLPKNFNKPYFATSPIDFWRKWHISLSTWLRDYLYIPLGGNRKSPHRTYLNLAIVMFLGGLWHGASWNFVLWGLLHSAYLSINHIVLKQFPRTQNHTFLKSKFGRMILILITQYFVFLAWIPFRIHDSTAMLYAMQKYIFLDFQHDFFVFIYDHFIPLVFLFSFISLQIISYLYPNTLEKISHLRLSYWTVFFITVLGLVVFTYTGNPEDFIYFRF